MSHSSNMPIHHRDISLTHHRALKNPTYIAIGMTVSVLLIWIGLLLQAVSVADRANTGIWIIAGILLHNVGITGLMVELLALGIGRWEYPQALRAALVLGATMLVIWDLQVC